MKLPLFLLFAVALAFSAAAVECAADLSQGGDSCTVSASLTLNGTYVVNMNGTTTDAAIVINAVDIILDCNNSAIFGNFSVAPAVHSMGVYSSHKTSTIKNCNFSNFYYGAYGGFFNDSLIDNSTFSSNYIGVARSSALSFNNSIINNSHFFQNKYSDIYSNADNSYNLRVLGCDFHNASRYGIETVNSSNDLYANNTFYSDYDGSSNSGIFLGGIGSIVDSNIFYGSGRLYSYNIAVQSNNSRIQNNWMNYTQYSIAISPSALNNITIFNNTIINSDMGTSISNVTNVNFSYNTIRNMTYGNLFDSYNVGFKITNSSNVLLQNNNWTEIATVGVLVHYTQNLSLVNNNFDFIPLSQRSQYAASDGYEPRCAIQSTQRYKGWKHYLVGSDNLTLSGNTFDADTPCYLHLENQTQLTHDLANYWYRSFRVVTNWSGREEFYVPNSFSNLSRYSSGTFYDFRIEQKEGVDEGGVSHNQSNLPSLYSFFQNINATETYQINLFNLTDAYLWFSNGTTYNHVTGDLNVTLQPSNSLTINASTVNISACQSLTTANEVYVLNQSVSSTGTCFTVTADNIILDCNGYIVNYSGTTAGYGVYANSANNFTVKNCYVNQTGNAAAINNSYAIFLDNSNYSTVYNLTIVTRGGSGTASQRYNIGVYANYSGYTNLTNNTIITLGSRGAGIRLIYSDNTTVKSNNVTTSEYGAYALSTTSSNSATISFNNFTTLLRLGYGIVLAESVNSTVSNNNINTSQVSGVLLVGSSIQEFNHSIDTSNLVEGLPLNYTFNLQNALYQHENWTNLYGEVLCGFCQNVTYYNISMGNDGFVLANSSYVNLTENRVTTNNGFGILFYPYSWNGIIESNNITTTGVYGAGIWISIRGSANITNNRVNTTENTSQGITLEWVNSTNVSNNIVMTSGVESAGIVVGGATSAKNNITNNTIMTTGEYGYGIYSYASSNNEFSNNNITTSGLRGYAVLLNPANNNTFRGNRITTYADYGNGYRLANNSTNNIISDGNITTYGGIHAWGLYSLGSNSNSIIIINLSITTTAAPALDLEDTTFSAINSIISAAGAVPDVYLYGQGVSNLLNCSFNKSDTLFDALSTALLNVSWYLSVYVNDTSGNPIPSASVSIDNINGTTVATGTTNASGWANFNVTEYTQNITGIYNQTPHTLTASKSGYYSSSAQKNVSESWVSIPVVLTMNPWSSGGGGGGGASPTPTITTNATNETANVTNITVTPEIESANFEVGSLNFWAVVLGIAFLSLILLAASRRKRGR